MVLYADVGCSESNDACKSPDRSNLNVSTAYTGNQSDCITLAVQRLRVMSDLFKNPTFQGVTRMSNTMFMDRSLSQLGRSDVPDLPMIAEV